MKLSIYILTGGKSSRMKTDKAFTIYNGKTFLSRIIDSVSFLESKINLISKNPKHKQLGIECIPDIISDKGPVGGVTTALQNSNTELNLILSCDIPLIQPELIEWLINNHQSKYNGTVACYNSKQMPLIAIYNTNCLSIFEKSLKEDQLKLMTVLKDLNINYIQIPTKMAPQLTNINTPEELEEASKTIVYDRK